MTYNKNNLHFSSYKGLLASQISSLACLSILQLFLRISAAGQKPNGESYGSNSWEHHSPEVLLKSLMQQLKVICLKNRNYIIYHLPMKVIQHCKIRLQLCFILSCYWIIPEWKHSSGKCCLWLLVNWEMLSVEEAQAEEHTFSNVMASSSDELGAFLGLLYLENRKRTDKFLALRVVEPLGICWSALDRGDKSVEEQSSPIVAGGSLAVLQLTSRQEGSAGGRLWQRREPSLSFIRVLS